MGVSRQGVDEGLKRDSRIRAGAREEGSGKIIPDREDPSPVSQDPMLPGTIYRGIYQKAAAAAPGRRRDEADPTPGSRIGTHPPLRLRPGVRRGDPQT